MLTLDKQLQIAKKEYDRCHVLFVQEVERIKQLDKDGIVKIGISFKHDKQYNDVTREFSKVCDTYKVLESKIKIINN